MAQMDRILVTQIRKDLDAALAMIGKKHGLTMRTGNALFSESQGTLRMKIEAALNDVSTGAPGSIELVNFKKYAGTYGVPQDALDLPLRIGGKTMMLVGMNRPRRARPGCRTYPFVAETVGRRRRFKLTASQVITAYQDAKRGA